jgi:hypothetical protein
VYYRGRGVRCITAGGVSRNAAGVGTHRAVLLARAEVALNSLVQLRLVARPHPHPAVVLQLHPHHIPPLPVTGLLAVTKAKLAK